MNERVIVLQTTPKQAAVEPYRAPRAYSRFTMLVVALIGAFFASIAWWYLCQHALREYPGWLNLLAFISLVLLGSGAATWSLQVVRKHKSKTTTTYRA